MPFLGRNFLVVFELTPRIPEGPPAVALWQALAAAQRPAGLAQFLEAWLPTNPGGSRFAGRYVAALAGDGAGAAGPYPARLAV